VLWNLLKYKEQGLIHGSCDQLDLIVQKGVFRNRKELEYDPLFKQIISYAVISNKGSYFLFTRKQGQAEKRLHNKISLGVGGHMNPGSSGTMSAQFFTNELKRELKEELRFENGCHTDKIEFIGFINDDTIPVGRVHIGLLYDIHVSGKEVYINEPDKMSGEWIDKDGLVRQYEFLETWSGIVFDSYLKLREWENGGY
jgi:predicted NUDIX family phosphoesterase